MSVITLPNGTGCTIRGNLGDAGPVEVNGNVWYVHYGTGTDAVSPAGQNRQAPLKTIAQAVTNSASGDVIVLMIGHDETTTASLSISKNLFIIGEGTDGGKPSAKLSNNGAATYLLSYSGSGMLVIKNIYFGQQVQACSSPKVYMSGGNSSVFISNCYFECGQYDDAAEILMGQMEVLSIKNTTFVSAAESLGTRPRAVLDRTGTNPCAVVLLDGVSVDGGEYGWTDSHAVDLTGAVLSFFCAENISLLRGSDIRVPQNTLGYINVRTSTDDCRIDWDGVA